MLTGCAGENLKDGSGGAAEGSGSGIYSPDTITRDTSGYEKETPAEGNISDNNMLYADEDDSSVLTMHLTVSSGNSADGSDHTWSEINEYSAYYYDDLGIDRYQTEGLLRIGEEGDEETFGYDTDLPNVSVQVRGQTSSKNAQKNYKIRIKKGLGSFRGQRTLNLNKHMTIAYRFNNKLAYDLLEDIPQLMSARTQFVHLYVTDNTQGGSGQEEDYGLYVMVEQMNRTYLREHGLDENGRMYKVNFFEWYTYDEIMADPEDGSFDLDAFEEYLEVKGSDDHSTLQEVLLKLENYQIPTKEIVEEHFNVENLMYWAAFQILIGNYDSGARNLFIYSPLNSERLYFISWDMDGAFQESYFKMKNYSEAGSWEQGITQYTGLVLFRRMLKEPEYRDALTAAVEDLYRNYLTREKIESKVKTYSGIVEQYLFQAPDSERSRFDTPEEYEALASLIPDDIDENYRQYQESLNMPWPFFVALPEKDHGKLVFSWESSYDPGGESVTYDYVLARDYDFTDVITRGSKLDVPSFEYDMLEPGEYYLKVVAENESGYRVDCFDYQSVSGKGKKYGCYKFYVLEDGTVSIYEDGGV